jgi:integrase
MKIVEPIRDKEKIEAMRRYLSSPERTFAVRDSLMFTLGMNSGLRIGDILDLTLEQIVDGGKPREFVEVEEEEKTGKRNRFALGKKIQQAILSYVKEYPDAKPTDPVFFSRKRIDKGNRKKAITRVQAWQILSTAARAVGIVDRIGSHSLRKSFGYHHYRAGIDVTMIQTIFNHSHPKETLRYLGITQDEKDKVFVSSNL